MGGGRERKGIPHEHPQRGILVPTCLRFLSRGKVIQEAKSLKEREVEWCRAEKKGSSFSSPDLIAGGHPCSWRKFPIFPNLNG